MSQPGYGDAATWGSVTSIRDPRASSFMHTFDTTVGMGSAPVTVTAEVWRHGPISGIESVIHRGNEVIGLLDDSQIEQLEKSAAADLLRH